MPFRGRNGDVPLQLNKMLQFGFLKCPNLFAFNYKIILTRYYT